MRHSVRHMALLFHRKERNMEIKYTQTEKAPAAIGPYSQAVSVGNLLFTSGQIPIDPATGEKLVEGAEPETPIDERWNALAALKADTPDPDDEAVRPAASHTEKS